MLIKEDKKFKEIFCFDSYWKLRDASINRLLKHNEKGVAIISAMRGGIPFRKKYEDFTEEEKKTFVENVRKTEELKKKIRQKGFGYIQTLGGFRESREDEPGEVDVREYSLVVPYRPELMTEEEFLNTIAGWMKEYNQDNFIVAGLVSINNGQPAILDPKKNISMYFTNVDKYENLDIENRPYYTQLNKNEQNIVYTADSKYRPYDWIATRTTRGVGGHMLANKNKEIILY